MKKINLRSKPLIISGPCSAETEEQTVGTCMQLAATGLVDVLRAGIWKPRTHPGSFEGSGTKGLSWMAKAGKITGLPIAVEVAVPKHVESALKYGVDAVWIGSRTTVSPFAVQELAEALRGNREITVFIKNPVNPDPDLWAGAVERLENAGVDRLRTGLIHRGFSCFGHSKYRNVPMWHVVLEMRNRFPDMVMICDPSHICGRREYLMEVSQTAADLQYDGLMVESHIYPDRALSDAAQQLTPTDLAAMLGKIVWRPESADDPEFRRSLEIYRNEIDRIDSELLELLGRRMEIAEKIGEAKLRNNVAILQGRRWNSITERFIVQSKRLGLSEEFIKAVLEAIHTESINRQNRIMNK